MHAYSERDSSDLDKLLAIALSSKACIAINPAPAALHDCLLGCLGGTKRLSGKMEGGSPVDIY